MAAPVDQMERPRSRVSQWELFGRLLDKGWIRLSILAAMLVLGGLCGMGRFTEAAALALACLFLGVVVARRDLRFALLGLALPIYGATGVPPITVVALRFSLVGLIILLDLGALRSKNYRMPGWQWWLYGIGLLVAATLHGSFGGAYLAISFGIAALLGARIATDERALALFLGGFRAGVVASSVALLASVLNVVNLSIVAQTEGFAGMSSRSTAFSYEAAFALVAWYWMAPRRRRVGWGRVLWLAEGMTVSMALLASGGRGGLVALVVALVLLPLSAGRLTVGFRFIFCAAAGVAVIAALNIPTLSIDRLIPQARDRRIAVVDQYGSGRLDAYQRGIEVARGNLVFGAGFDAASLGNIGATEQPADPTQRQASHQLLLALVIAGGLGLAACALVLLFDAGRNAYRLMRRRDGAGWWLAAATTIFLVSTLLEIGGGLIGFQSVLLFSIVCTGMRNLDGAPRSLSAAA